MKNVCDIIEDDIRIPMNADGASLDRKGPTVEQKKVYKKHLFRDDKFADGDLRCFINGCL